MAAQQNKRKAENRKIRQDALREQLAGQKIIEGIDRNVGRLEKLVDKAGKSDREGLDRIKVQMQGLNQVLAVQQKKLNKLLPDAQAVNDVERSASEQVTPEDRQFAALHGLGVTEYLERKAADTLPPTPEIPETRKVHPWSAPTDNAKGVGMGCRKS